MINVISLAFVYTYKTLTIMYFYRTFSYCTSKARVYDVVDETFEEEVDHRHCSICSVGTLVLPQRIVTR